MGEADRQFSLGDIALVASGAAPKAVESLPVWS